MVLSWKEQLEQLLPGPSPIKERKEVQLAVAESWDDKPFIFAVGGVEQEFFSIGHLAKALNRKPGTLRKWEENGIIPRTPYTKPSVDPRGRRRMYTRAMVEGIIKITKEEEVWLPDKGRRLSETRFQPRVLELFHSLLRK
jgi:hypothetical protein